MTVGVNLRAAQLGAGVNASMRQFIHEDQIIGADHGRNDPGIGKIAGTEHAGRLAALQSRQPHFKFVVEWMIAGNQARRAGADPIAFNGIDGRGDDLGVLTEVQIIVARERQQTAAVALGPNSRARRDHRHAAKLRAFERRKLVAGKSIERTHVRSSLPFERT